MININDQGMQKNRDRCVQICKMLALILIKIMYKGENLSFQSARN